MKLRTLTNDANFEAFVKSEWLYTDRDFFRYKTMANAVATMLHDRCVSKQLVLDLDVASHMKQTSKKPGEGCE